MNSMEKELLESVYKTLNRYQKEYFFTNTRKEKDLIENFVRNYLDSIPNELYLELNNGAGSGLCRRGFFESDLSKCLSVLERMIGVL